MATGISAAKRKAKKAAADQYYKVFRELKAADTDYKASTNNKKQVVEALGDDVSYNIKRLAMKADKTGRAINNDTEYRTDLKRYNARYESLKKQLKGESVERYKISSDPSAVVKPVKNNGNYNPQINQKTSAADYATFKPSSESVGKKRAKTDYYDTQEEAMQAAQLKMDSYNTSLDGKLGQKIESTKRPNSSSQTLGNIGNIPFSPRGNYTQFYIDAMKVSDPSRFVEKERLSAIPVGYRNLDAMGDAYHEISALSERAGKSPVNQQAEQYAKVTEQLKQKLKREQGAVSNKPQGLLASELAGNNLNPEVIRA